MRFASIAAIGLLVLLGLAAGIAKIMRVPDELAFFAAAGLGATAVTAFGIAQVAGALLMAMPGTRVPGAALLCVSFGISAAMILAQGQLWLGLVALVPTAVTAAIVFLSAGRAPDSNET